MEARDEGTTSVSKTSVENVVMAALRDGLLARACWPVSDIAAWPSRSRKEIYVPSSVLNSNLPLPKTNIRNEHINICFNIN